MRHGFVREAPFLGVPESSAGSGRSAGPTTGKDQGLSQNPCIDQMVNEAAADEDRDSSASHFCFWGASGPVSDRWRSGSI